MNNTSDKAIYSAPVIDFITVSAEYCVFLEKSEQVSRTQLLDRVTKLLPLVYVKATLLPRDIEVEGDDELPEVVTEEDYNFVQHRVWQLLRDDDTYLEVFTPNLPVGDEQMTCSISEDLADIYQDLKNFVAAFADGNEMNMNNAIHKVCENFEIYWGQRLVNVMRPLHELTYGEASHSEEDADDSLHDDTMNFDTK